MSERLSMMPGHCDRHDLRYDSLGCPVCVVNKFDYERSAPTLSPEEQAVLEGVAALPWDELMRILHLRTTEWRAMNDLRAAVRAWQATQKPKDYAPDELEPGQRFRFADVPKSNPERLGGEVVDVSTAEAGRGPLWKRMWRSDDGRVFSFHRPDRLIPLPEQDD